MGLAGQVQQKNKGQKVCLENSDKHSKPVIVIFLNSAFCMCMTNFLFSLRAGTMGQILSPESLMQCYTLATHNKKLNT